MVNVAYKILVRFQRGKLVILMDSKENFNSTLVAISPAETKPFFFVLEFVLENHRPQSCQNLLAQLLKGNRFERLIHAGAR